MGSTSKQTIHATSSSGDSAMTREEACALPVSFDIVTAGRGFGIGRTKAHELARSGEFPCRVLRIGNQYRVTRSDLLNALGIDPT